MPDRQVIEAPLTLSPGVSLIWVLLFGSCVTVPFFFSLWRFLAYRSRAMRAESIAKQPSRVDEGPALLQGTIETEDGGPAVRIEIDQVGSEKASKNSYSHTWEERHRVVHVRPFRLRVPGEETVHVIPDERIRLVDTLETDKVEPYYRRRVAELSDKERVWVSGVLSRAAPIGKPSTAYRDGPAPWQMRGTLLEPLEVASGGLARQFSYWRGFYRKASIVLGVLFALAHFGLFGSFYALYWLGRVETVAIERTSTYTTTHKGNTTTHYVAHGHLSRRAGRGEVEGEVDYRDYLEIKQGTITATPFVYVPHATFIHAIGTGAQLSLPRAVCATVCGSLLVLAFLFTRRSAMPWYEQKQVVERGTGSLAEKAWYAQEPGQPGLFVPRAPPPAVPKTYTAPS